MIHPADLNANLANFPAVNDPDRGASLADRLDQSIAIDPSDGWVQSFVANAMGEIDLIDARVIAANEQLLRRLGTLQHDRFWADSNPRRDGSGEAEDRDQTRNSQPNLLASDSLSHHTLRDDQPARPTERRSIWLIRVSELRIREPFTGGVGLVK